MLRIASLAHVLQKLLLRQGITTQARSYINLDYVGLQSFILWNWPLTTATYVCICCMLLYIPWTSVVCQHSIVLLPVLIAADQKTLLLKMHAFMLIPGKWAVWVHATKLTINCIIYSSILHQCLNCSSSLCCTNWKLLPIDHSHKCRFMDCGLNIILHSLEDEPLLLNGELQLNRCHN